MTTRAVPVVQRSRPVELAHGHGRAARRHVLHRVHIGQRAHIGQSRVGGRLACQQLESLSGDLLGGVGLPPRPPFLQQERQGTGDGLVAELAVGRHEGGIDHGVVSASGKHPTNRRFPVEPKGWSISQARIEPVYAAPVALVASGALLLVELLARLFLFCRIGVGYHRRDERADGKQADQRGLNGFSWRQEGFPAWHGRVNANGFRRRFAYP